MTFGMQKKLYLFIEVNRNCKKIPCSLANGPQRIWKEGTTGRWYALVTHLLYSASEW